VTRTPEDERLRGLLFKFAVGLFVAGFVIAVVAVLWRPERVVLIGMDEREASWVRAKLKKFADDHHANLKFVAYGSPAEFDSLMAADRHARSPRILLAEAPVERLAALVDWGRRPLGRLPESDRASCSRRSPSRAQRASALLRPVARDHGLPVTRRRVSPRAVAHAGEAPARSTRGCAKRTASACRRTSGSRTIRRTGTRTTC
jgi:hypothetical protein